MRWDNVAKATAAAAAADPTLAGIFGPTIRMSASAQTHVVPSLEYHLIADSASELWEPAVFQWDIWTDTMVELVTAERALRKLFDLRLPDLIEGVYMFAEFTEGFELVSPDLAGYFGRAVRFRFSPIREDLRCGRS
jgi:hypothetical protein